jgi:HAD superfamily hydrolase (TIGR01490 family)
MTVAFFDLDNTLVKGSSLFYFAKYLVKTGILSKRELAKFASAQARFISSKTEDPKIQNEIKTKALEIVRGKNQKDILELCENSLAENLYESLYPEVIQFLDWHQKRGHLTWIVTASPVEIASGIAKKLKMTGALGTISEVQNQKYTGNLLTEILHGKNKADAVKSLAKSMSLNLDNAFAYSDSINDLPLLCTVGTAIVVNPNKELQRIAKKNSWQEIDTQKSIKIA